MSLTIKKIGVPSQIVFILCSSIALIGLYTSLRIALLIYNLELLDHPSLSDLISSFTNGVRFDGKMIAWIMLPIICFLILGHFKRARFIQRLWLTVAASIALLLGLIELDFYHEFHHRLNNLMFEYIKADPITVLRMIWHGYAVIKFLLVWSVGSIFFWFFFAFLDAKTKESKAQRPPLYIRSGLFLMCFCVIALSIRGTLRQGPPLRWGDAYTTKSLFLNQLGLNGTLTLIDAMRNAQKSPGQLSSSTNQTLAQNIVRDMMVLKSTEVLVEPNQAAIRREYTPDPNKVLPVHNVVIILMESFSGYYTGVLGNKDNITPYFDQLSKEGLLFTHFFSNGTHTHQGMFASMACFPNLPGYETLMQKPEGSNFFSGLPQLLSKRNMNNLYVYNGDFSWDNQRGFFANQGMTHFIGRHDFINPVFYEPTWGVSDQDMFSRANEELNKLASQKKPFYALLQTLSNHSPYALPPKLPVSPVTNKRDLNKRLTAMRYSDWALGNFFEAAKKSTWFKDTLFVVVGDHGFGSPLQLTEIDLLSFHVPLLLIAPKIQEKFGNTIAITGTQVDIVPMIIGRLGAKTHHQCWGRDLLNLQAKDNGFGMIKPSSNDRSTAFINGDQILVRLPGLPPKLYQFKLGEKPFVLEQKNSSLLNELLKKLDAYVLIATRSLLNNTTGVGTGTKFDTKHSRHLA